MYFPSCPAGIDGNQLGSIKPDYLFCTSDNMPSQVDIDATS